MKQTTDLNSNLIVRTKLKKVNDVYILPPGYILNETGVKVIEYCDGRHSVKDIIMLISREYNERPTVVKKDVMKFIKRLLFLSALKVV
ncbi:MAG: PqqD family protein [Candidatus Aenigmatarchaeota archaeon]